MVRPILRVVVVMLLCGSTAVVLLAQPPGKKDRGKDKASADKPMTTDPALLDAYRDFIKKVEGVAADYEKNKQPDKAKDCYEEILRLAPEYTKAKDKVKYLTELEYTADHKVAEVLANDEWQDSGISVSTGKPIRISATGTWTISFTQKVGPAGVEVPDGMRDMNPGELAGFIGANPKEGKGKPFAIGEKLDLTPEHSGKLWLRMFCPAVGKNTGKLTVQISGTFERSK